MALLFLSSAERGAVWKQVFEAAGEKILLGAGEVTDPAEVTHLLCWTPPESLSAYPNLKVVICAGAGVDHLPPLPPGVQLSRTIAPGIDEMVRDWVVMACLMLHREMPRYLEQASRGQWQEHPARLSRTRRVGIMGMGRIGVKVAQALTALGFPVAGYSRSGRSDGAEGIALFGPDRLNAFLAQSDLVVSLLPLTAETRGLMNAEFFAGLPKGALVVNAGRGAQMDLPALRAALETGQVAAAMLDVTDPEPLPEGHWLWSDPRVIVTPHIGALTDHEEGARHGLAVIAASRSGAPVPGLVDQARGY